MSGPRRAEPHPRGGPLREALGKWQDAAGLWWPYVCATPFLSDLSPRLEVAPAARFPAMLRGNPVFQLPAPRTGAPLRTAVFADLPPEPVLAATVRLNRLGYVVVPVIQRWVTRPAVLPGRRLLEQLVAQGRRAVRPLDPRGVVFVLDGDRAGPAAAAAVRTGPSPRRAFDNRYRYPVCRFPPPALLVDAGISTICWIPEPPAVDLQPYAAQLDAAGLRRAASPRPG